MEKLGNIYQNKIAWKILLMNMNQNSRIEKSTVEGKPKDAKNFAPSDKPRVSEENQLVAHILTNEMLSALEKDDPRMADIIRRRYILGEDQKDVAKYYKVSQVRISQIEKKAIDKMRK